MHKKTKMISLIFIALFLFVATDAIMAKIYLMVVGYPFYKRSENLIQKEEDSIRKKAKKYRTASHLYHHDLKKNCKETAQFGVRIYSFCTDSYGFRCRCSKRDLPLNKDDSLERKRILFLGDSFTEGVGIEYENTFVGIIENSLSLNSIDVFNAGVASYSPSIYWRKTKYLIEDIGFHFDYLVVFLDISDIEDEAIVYDISPNGNIIKMDKPINKNRENKFENTKNFIKSNFVILYYSLNKLYDFIYNNGSCLDKEIDSNYFINKKRSLWTIDKNYFEEYGKKGIEKSKYFLNLLHNLLRKHDIEMYLCVYPWPDQIISNDLNSIQVSFWSNWATSKGINFINFFPLFFSSRSETTRNETTIEKFYIKGDMHWNELGHRLIGQNFLAHFINPNERKKEGN